MTPKLSSFHSKVTIKRKVPIPMRDGVNLTADIYRPKGVDVPLPVLLMRLPYGRAIASTVTYAHPSWYANRGYIVVIQDVRGCGTSGGEFYPFRHEYEDGFDTVQWCAQILSGTNGKVGMYGFSYQGVTQFQAAVMQPAGLTTICPAMATADFYHGWFYFGGALCLDFVLTWALQLTQNRAQFLKQEPQATQLFEAQKQMERWLNFAPLDRLELFQSEAQESVKHFWFDWIGNQQPNDPYWQKLNPVSYFDRYDIPALHIAGWSDLFIEATLNTYHMAKLATRQPQHLVVAPWQHMPWLPKVGEVDFGEAAISHIDELQIDWFDYWLKGIDNGIVTQRQGSRLRSDRKPTAQLFLMGENRWLILQDFNDKNSNLDKYRKNKDLFLHDKHQLKAEKATIESLPDIYVYDPRLPNPSTAYVPCDQRSTHQRWDVLVYKGDVLAENLSIAGTAEFTLYAVTSAPDTDWVIKLLDIHPDGKQMLVSMGVLRAKFHKSWEAAEWIDTDLVTEYKIRLRPTCYSFLSGHRIGVAIASAAFPLIERHSNTKQSPTSANVSDFIEATQQIYHSGEFPSCLHLPLLTGEFRA
ncbi:CocE/NonD family hydrolase [Tumidithrix elongata RA019]|uniref:CocE/NonD family hydrolase n=1 Tax=Tumidithrix elongata BACA0141 TaxID=2716417 RepID=A0AAW9PXN2_9CYAN|nr:CocE/NonD family hydrolase [Tumidithrix elongata RA019]